MRWACTYGRIRATEERTVRQRTPRMTVDRIHAAGGCRARPGSGIPRGTSLER